MKPIIFIQSNARQRLGAEIARYALIRNSAAPERFEIRFLSIDDFPAIAANDGKPYLRHGETIRWDANDLQSFTPLRFAAAEQAGFRGRALVIDPDVFALADVNQLLDRDMGAHAIVARREPEGRGRPAHHSSSVMLLDCARLAHWQFDRQFSELFEARRDYRDWIWLLREPQETIGDLETWWNDFDRLEADTCMLHNTERSTQPWKTGLPTEFVTYHHKFKKRLGRQLRKIGNALTFGDAPNGRYLPHPDRAQEHFFFGLVAEALDRGVVTRELVEQEMALKHLRRDAYACIEAARVAGIRLAA